MTSIPTIPAYVPFCHKNYEVAEQLVGLLYGIDPKRPFFFSENAWDFVISEFQEYQKIGKENVLQDAWQYVEDFFVNLKEKIENGEKSKDGQGEAVASLDLEDGQSSDSQETTEDILDLKDPRDRADHELTERILENLDDVSIERLRLNINKINDIIEGSFSFKKTQKTEPDPDFRNFSQIEANIKELGRISQKYMLALDELEDLMLYRALNGELTATKSIKKAQRVIFVMIDDSGSMNESKKIGYVNLILKKIKEKLNENTDAFVFSFESDLYSDFFDLKKKLPKMSLKGGGTNIERSIKSLFEKIKIDFDIDFQDISILIINDGEDNISDFRPPCKVSSLILKTKNEKLSTFCRNSGGKSYTIN